MWFVKVVNVTTNCRCKGDVSDSSSSLQARPRSVRPAGRMSVDVWNDGETP